MFIGTGISYIVMGSLFFLKNKLHLESNWLSDRLQLSLFVTGCILLVFSVVDFFIDSRFLFIIFAVVLLTFVITSLKSVSDYMKALEVIDKLTKDN